MKKSDMIIIVVLFFGLCSCIQTELKFDDKLWNESTDGIYEHREKMIEDLMENKLKEGMSHQSIIDLLGNPVNFADLDSNSIGYEIFIDYGWDIDPLETKTLLIDVSSDSTIIDFRLEHWKK